MAVTPTIGYIIFYGLASIVAWTAYKTWKDTRK